MKLSINWPPIALGMTVAIGYMAVATVLVGHTDFGAYPEIQYVCQNIGATTAACRAGALSVGQTMIIGLVVAAIVAMPLLWLDRERKEAQCDRGILIVSAALALVCALHVLSSDAFTPRISALVSEGHWISIENLMWPLLLQLLILTSDNRSRLIAGSTLLLAAAMSPFRGVFFAIVLFGGILPLATHLSRRTFLYLCIIGAVLAGVVLWQTSNRSDSARGYVVARAMSQRIIMPLFQGFAAERIDHLPTFADNIEQKLRISKGPNLNQYLFDRIYGMGIGETTALFYGEGVANVRYPVAWIVGATLLPVLIALGLAQFGVAAGVIAGLAIWRGSLGGLSDVFPAMAIQMSFLVLSRFINFERTHGLRLLPKLIAAVILAASAWHFASVMTATHHSQVFGTFKLSSGAAAALKKCGKVGDVVNRRAEMKSMRDAAVPTTVGIFQDTLTVGVGTTIDDPDEFYRLYKAVEGDLAANIASCGAGGIEFEYSHEERAAGVSPLDVVALIAAMLSFVLFFSGDSRPWFFTAAAVPYSYLFTLPPTSTSLIVGLGLLGTALCAAPQILTSIRILRVSSYGVILLAFAVLVFLHLTPPWLLAIQGAGFLGCLVALFVAVRSRFALNEQWLQRTAWSITVGIAVAAILSAIFAYVPLPVLAMQHPPTDNLRLSGIFDEANAGGRYLMIAFLFFFLKTWFWPLLVISAALAATGSKGALIATFCMAAFVIVAEGTVRWRRLTHLLGSIVVIGGWLLFVQPPLEQHAEAAWMRIATDQGATETSPRASQANGFADELRIGTSSRMVEQGGVVVYQQRPYSLWHTGQRDLLWSAGIATIKDHPLWGIGYKKWKAELKRRLDYPFSSPHNGALEITGAYGLIGALLYVALVALFLRNTVRVLRHSEPDFGLLWATAAAGGMLLFELVDVSTSLAVTLPAVLFWAFLAIQEARLHATCRYRGSSGSGSTAEAASALQTAP